MLSAVCIKQKANRCINFLLVDFSILFILVVVMHTSLVAILLHVLLQQQAMAYSMNIINTATTDPVDVKTPISNNDLLSYQNRALGLLMQYPSNWEKIEDGKEVERYDKNAPDQASSDEQVVEFVSPLETPTLDKYREVLSISVHKLHTGNIGEFFGLFDKPTSQKILLHGFVLSHLTSLIAKLPFFDLIKSESGNDEVTLADGSLGHKIVYTYKGKGQISNNAYLKVMEVLTVSRDRGYIIRYSSEPLKYYSYLPTIQRMISSFRVTTK
jgi:hypothetical protein